MDGVITVILLMLGCVLVWVIFCCILFVRNYKCLVVYENFIANVICEKCNTHYSVNAEDFMKSKFVKYKKTAKKKRDGIAGKKDVHYISYCKRFDCPCCEKKRFGRVENINELNRTAAPMVTGLAFKCLIYMVLGGFVIMLIFQLPLAFAKRDKQKKIDEMKQQMYEATLEKSGLNIEN